MRKIIIIPIMLCSLFHNIYAEQIPQSLSKDHRIKVVIYDPNNVVKINVNQLITTDIQFADDEEIIMAEAGDSAAWQNKINKHRANVVLIKPTMDDADTDYTVVTNKRIYHFKLVAKALNDNDVTYSVKFLYPEDEKIKASAELREKKHLLQIQASELPLEPQKWNINYSYGSGCSINLVPKHVFDDDKFTYFEFNIHQKIPAIYITDQSGNESLVNWSMRGKYVVVQQLARQFTLRDGHVVTCIFNDSYSS